MNWRHKLALERFSGRRSCVFYQVPGVGERSWKALIEKGWIERVSDDKAKWWQAKWKITNAGKAALSGEDVSRETTL